MKQVGVIAGRELRSLFAQPVVYAMLALFALLAGFLFLSKLVDFNLTLLQLQNNQLLDPNAGRQLLRMNLNDGLIAPFFAAMLALLLFVIPGMTMGSFALEKTNGTEELLLTSPLRPLEIVLGKYLAVAVFVALFVLIVAAFPALLFAFGAPPPEAGKALAGGIGLLGAGLCYAAVGVFSSSVTRNQSFAFFLGFVLCFSLLLFDLGRTDLHEPMLRACFGFLSLPSHVEPLLAGLVSTADLGYFAAIIGTFLLLAKTAVEAVRGR